MIMKMNPPRAVQYFAVALLSACLATPAFSAPATFTWSTTTTGSTWVNSANWTGGPANKVPGTDLNATTTTDNDSNDVAIFTTLAFSATTLGINMNQVANSGVAGNSGANQLLSLGAISFNGSKTIAVNNSSGTTPGVLQLNGATVNVGGTGGSIANLLAAVNDSSSFDFSLTNGASFAMDIRLGITGGAVYVTSGRSMTFGSKITELNTNSGLTKLGAGTFSMNNTNTFSGGVSINAGVLQTFDSLFPWGSGTITLNGGTFQRGAQNFTPSRANAYTNPVSITANSTIQTTTTSTRTVHFDSSFTSTAGTTLLVTNAAASGTNHFRLYGGGISYAGNINIGGNATGNNRSLLELYNTVADGGDQVFNGVISGAGIVYRNVESVVAGGNTILNAVNTYTSGTEIRAGFIGIGTNNALGSGNVMIGRDPNPLGVYAVGAARTIANDFICDVSSGSPSTAAGSTNLQVKGSQDLTLSGRLLIHTNMMFFTISNTALTTFSGVVSNAGAIPSPFGVIKQGPGTLVFSGSNAYGGKTIINDGKLVVNNVSGSGTSTGLVTVASGGTLGGTGIVSGALSVLSGGNLTPGTSIGTLTINNTLSLAGTTTIEVDKAAGQTSDKVLGISTLTEGGTLQVANVGAPLVVGDSFPVFSATTYSGSFTSVTPAPAAGLAWDTEKLRTNGVLLVHSQPVAGSDVASAQHGQATTIPVFKLLANDSGEAGETLSVTGVSPNASLSGGFVNYTAPLTGTSDIITYTLSDGRGGTSTGTINVTLTGSGGSFNQLSAVTIAGGDLKLSYLGIPGTNYALEISHDLTPPVSWSTLLTNTAAENGYIIFTNSPSLAPTNDFYRTRYAP